MKRIVVTILFVSVLFVGTLLFASCSNENIDADSKNSISISFFVDGAQYETKKLKKTDDITLPDAPSKEGYSFDGWYVDNGIWNTPLKEGTLLGQDIITDTNVYAKFTQMVYQIHYNSNGGKHTNATTYTVETSVELTAPEKIGFNFVGWYKDSDFTQKVTEIPVGTVGDITLYAKYDDGASYTISYEADGGEHDNPSSYTVTDSVKLNDAYKKGYAFLGWYTDNTYETKIDAINRGMYTHLTLYAKFELVSYTITYQDEMNKENNNPIAYTIENEFQLEPIYSRGYVFLGWFDGNNRVDKINEGSFGNMELTAKWAEINVDATKNIEAAGNVSGLENGVAVGAEATLSATTNSGYTWMGWYLGDEKVSNGNSTEFTFVVEDVQKVYKAKWTEYFVNINMTDGGELYKGYEVSFDLNGGTGDLPDTQYVNTLTKLVYPTVPTRSGYLFTGWYTEPECNNLFDWSKDVSADIKLYAGWYYAGEPDGKLIIENFNDSVSTEIGLDTTSNRYWKYIYFTVLDSRPTTLSFHYAHQFFSGNYAALDFKLYNVTQEKVIDNFETSNWGSGPYYKYHLDNTNVNVGDVVRLMVRYDYYYSAQILDNLTYSIYRSGEIETGRGTIPCKEGHYTAGDEVELSVTTKTGYTWLGWYNENSEKVADSLTYRFIMPNNSVTLTPKWELTNS